VSATKAFKGAPFGSATQDAHLSVALTKLRNKARIHLHLDALHIDSLEFVPSAHLGQHLSSFESVSRASL
jgi:hypothetical protein